MTKSLRVSLFFCFMFIFCFSILTHAKEDAKSSDSSESSSTDSGFDRGTLGRWHVDGFFSVGYAKPKPPVGEAPTMYGYTFGVTGGYHFHNDWFAGLTTDYRFYNQYSSVDVNIGNLRGTRWNLISPTVGYFYNRFFFKLDIQFLGDYKVTNQTANGTEVSYTSPFGVRVVGLYNFWRRLQAGLFYEYLSYTKQKDSVSGETTIPDKFVPYQIGVFAAWIY